MNSEADNMIMELRQGKLPQTTSLSTENAVKSIVIYSPNMDICVSLQMALENRYHITTATEAEMVVALVTTIKPDLAIMNVSSNTGRYLTMMKRVSPRTRVLLVVTSRRFDLAILSLSYSLVDGVFFEPVVIAELIRTIEATLHK